MIDDKIKPVFNCGGRLLDFSTPLIMGILNLTPDSFYDGGKHLNPGLWEERLLEMIDEGMDILDIGAYSSRPGAEDISLEEEWARLKPFLDLLSDKFGSLVVSLDTFRSEIARRAVLDYGVSIINDISGGNLDDSMFEVVSDLKVPYVLMHMQGTPQNMQDNPVYNNFISDILDYFTGRVKELRDRGVKDIIIDPGFGFGKTLDQNYILLNKLNYLGIFNLPVLAGLSRKSMIYKFLDQNPEDALTGSIFLNSVALQKGAGILRVHDVKEANICRKLHKKLSESQ